MGIVNNFFSRRVWFGVLMVISTITLSLSAAYYSVFGLSSLFAGARGEVIIMASSLEFSKLIVVSYLHNNWKLIGGLLKAYLTAVVMILMLITSAGIYGFLISAYQTTSNQLTILDKQTEVVNLKKNRFTEQVADYKLEKDQLNQSISELSKGLSNNVIQYTDRDGNIITTTSSATRRVLKSQLNDSKTRRDMLSIKMESLTDSITKLDLIVFDMVSNNEVAAEVGPLRYIAKITDKSMDDVVNWFTLLIVFVFDPLAVAMIIAINKYIGVSSTKSIPIKLSETDTTVAVESIETQPEPNEVLKDTTDEAKKFYGESKFIKKRYNDSVAHAENNK